MKRERKARDRDRNIKTQNGAVKQVERQEGK
jgi:hypothetical protein